MKPAIGVPKAVQTNKLKDSAALLGILYLLSFVLLLPFWLRLHGGVLKLAEVLVLAMVSVALVQALLNWLYLAVIAAPLIGAAVLGAAGLAVYVVTPLFVGVIGGVLKMGIPLLGAMGGIDFVVQNIGEFVSRLGQAGMILAGVLWWAVENARKIDYAALGVFLFATVSLGLAAGANSLAGAFFFLVVWLVLYTRLQSRGEMGKSLVLVFKLAATLVVIAGVGAIGVRYGGLWGTTVEFGLVKPPSEAYWDLLAFYRVLMGGLLVGGVWFPGVFLGRVPLSARDWVWRLVVSGTHWFGRV